MATYTPNLNLGKPEATDPFGNFRQLFNDNMDILDNGGGGGSGGHTIVNPSGTDMPAEGKLQFTGGVTVTDDSVNGKTVVDISGGGGNVYGAFIDTNRIIKSVTTISGNTTVTYTATEDCYVCIAVISDYDKASEVKIDNIRVWRNYNGSSGQQANALNVYLRKSQVISITNGSTTYNGSYTVYGLTQGTSGIFTPIIYSDTERVVGVWRDNKPLYARSFHYSFTASSNDYSYDIETLSSDIVVQKIETDRFSRDGVIFNEVIYPPNTIFFRYGVDESTHKLGVRVWNSDMNVIDGTVTLLYTKTTDVAGSGNWNTDGAPTVHYSTSEQVIGTWIDGKTIYQRTWDFSGSPVMLTYGTWVDSGISAGENIKAIISAELKYGTVANMGVEVAVNADGYPVAFQKIENTGNTRGVSYCTLKYTKTTD